MAKSTEPKVEEKVEASPLDVVQGDAAAKADDAKPAATRGSVKPKYEKMEIDRADFDRLISTIADQNKKISLLFDVADKGRLAKAQANSNGEPLIKTVKVSVWPDNKKFIVAWKLTRNISEIVNGRWIEDQKTLLVFSDGNSEEVSLLDFYRKPTKQKAEILSRSTTEKDGQSVQILKLKFTDGQELEIDANYIN